MAGALGMMLTSSFDFLSMTLNSSGISDVERQFTLQADPMFGRT